MALVKPQSSEWDKPHDAKDEDGEASAEDVGPNGVASHRGRDREGVRHHERVDDVVVRFRFGGAQ